MARKPQKAVATPAVPAAPNGLAEVLPETTGGLVIVQEMLQTLLDDAVKEVRELKPAPAVDEANVNLVIMNILDANIRLTKACVAAGLLPEEALTVIPKEADTNSK